MPQLQVSGFDIDIKMSQNNAIVGQSKLVRELPIITLSEANTIYSKTRLIKTGKNAGKPAREHWREAWQRHQQQKQAIHLAFNPLRDKLFLPCTVRLVRLGPRELDFDNLVISQKYVRDAIAEVLTQNFVPGRADSDKRITWIYDQEKAKEISLRIEISW